MARVMYFDCFSGAAGDMVLGALLDAGLPLDALQQALGSLGAGHEIKVTRVLRAGVSATHVEVLGDDHGPAHGHAHDHSHAHVHRSLHDISHLIGHSSLSATAKARARAMFLRLAEAEAEIHQMPVDKIHLHEVGAIDSIIDIAGAAFALEWFGIDDIVASPLNVGGGSVEIAHGTFPVPAPATLALLKGVPVYSGPIQKELVTPTGALVMSTYAKSFGPMPPMAVERIGYGAGTRDFEKVPNVLRVVIGERTDQAHAGAAAGSVMTIACELDDMSPQLFGPVSDALFAAGALDVFLTPVFMKKGRPGTLLTVLTAPALREAICALLFKETTTLGVRIQHVEREVLDRTSVDVTIPGGTVRIKVARRRGEVVNAAPEFDDCVRVAQATGRPIKDVQADAIRAWTDQKKNT
jgi:uncharacterized protein (TIGR00299 family) protein